MLLELSLTGQTEENPHSFSSSSYLREQTADLASRALEENIVDFAFSTQHQSDYDDLDFSTSPIKTTSAPTKSALANILSSSNVAQFPSSCANSQQLLDDTPADNNTTITSPIPSQQFATPHERTPLLKYDAPATPYGISSVQSNSVDTPVPIATHTQWRTRMHTFVKAHVNKETIVTECIVRPASYLPSVMLGLLLNILDGLSYGMILFPLAEPVFAHLGPAGLSMFYVSCVVSQLTYSLGASAFYNGVGSEMIEVVPFFHAMANTLLLEIGSDNPDAVIATTILAFALSSIVTGLVFFALGWARLGALVGFFPRHILVGCIGGVGWFLIVTGIEVSSRMNGNLEYNRDSLQFLFYSTDQFGVPVLFKWVIPIALAAVLMLVQKKVTQHPLLVPGYFLAVFIGFHVVVLAIPNFSYQFIRDAGWLFQGPSSSEPWWYFYTLYKFNKVDYWALLKTVPAMFALTFFGILHVPINVPALAASIGEDDVNIDNELLAHGISNALSGLIGSIQNYLVYTNSVLFIRSGADSRLAGVMLALATFATMLAGPDVIGFIPVMLVGALIFLLGFELIEEALIDTYGRVSKFEYVTILVIVVTMGAVDFVVGILIGILLACVSMVITSSQRSAIKASFTGEIARSTVRRNAIQQQFISDVGDQIYVLRLSGNLFFGTIVRVEQKVRDLMDDNKYFKEKPIRYLIFDMSTVTGIDFSAAETFSRMKRLLDKKKAFMLIAGLSDDDTGTVQSLRAVGLFYNEGDIEQSFCDDDDDDEPYVRMFPNLNSALEWSENQFLRTYLTLKHKTTPTVVPQTPPLQTAKNLSEPPTLTASQLLPFSSEAVGMPEPGTTPRVHLLQQSAHQRVREDHAHSMQLPSTVPDPVRLFVQTFRAVSTRASTSRVDLEFWTRVVGYFKKRTVPGGTVLYHSESPATGFYVVESGILRAEYKLDQGEMYESILAGTTCGELPFFSETRRTATVSAEVDSVVWVLDRDGWEAMAAGEGNEAREMVEEMYRMAMRLTVERFMSVMAYILISGGR